MAGFIPEDKISEILNSVDIVDIISEVVLLKQTGRNFSGLCPFHSEKTPSFSVSREKQIFYCFGCGIGGNVFSFLVKYEGLNFIEAVRKMASRGGIEISDNFISPEIKKRVAEKEEIHTLNKDAVIFFQKNLKSENGKRAFEYLETRGIKKDVIELFQIGFAPRGWDNLVRFFSEKSIRSDTLEKAGLISSRQNGKGFYDRFRDRIIFPIVNIRNQVVGFGGRVMDESLPKYLNTPETPIFNKSRILYGLHLTKMACREVSTVFLVEGYFDLVALYQHGIKNVAATMGTALTLDHIRMLKGFAEKVILVFDSDEAGSKAAFRSIPLFKQEHVEARVMVLPKGHDPDSYVFKFGSETFNKLADKASGIMAYMIEAAVSRHGLSSEGKVAIISQMKEPLISVEDPVARSIYIRELSERIDVDESLILESIRKESLNIQKKNRLSKDSRIDCSKSRYSQEQENEKSFDGAGYKTESKIISMMFQCPDIFTEIMAYEVLDLFENNNLKAIGKAMLLLYETKGTSSIDPSDLLPYLQTEFQRSLASSLAMGDEDCWNDTKSRKLQLIFQFIKYAKRSKEKHLMQQIKEAEANKDINLLSKLLLEQQKLALASQEQKLSLLKQSSNMTIFE